MKLIQVLLFLVLAVSQFITGESPSIPSHFEAVLPILSPYLYYLEDAKGSGNRTELLRLLEVGIKRLNNIRLKIDGSDKNQTAKQISSSIKTITKLSEKLKNDMLNSMDIDDDQFSDFVNDLFEEAKLVACEYVSHQNPNTQGNLYFI